MRKDFHRFPVNFNLPRVSSLQKMNSASRRSVAPAMKSFLAVTTFAFIALSSCAGDPGHFNGVQKGPQRRGSGNAQLQGPSARDVISDVHYDRARQNYEDRRERKY
jgi:hypothetical protein